MLIYVNFMKILYFASLRETLNASYEELSVTDNITVAKLKTILIKKYGEKLFPANILCAVNQEIASDNTIVNNNNEVAFYPPVTGG